MRSILKMDFVLRTDPGDDLLRNQPKIAPKKGREEGEGTTRQGEERKQQATRDKEKAR